MKIKFLLLLFTIYVQKATVEEKATVLVISRSSSDTFR